MKKRIKLTESQLHNVIRKCINEALDEIGDTHPGGRIGFAQHAADLAIERGRTKQGQNILNSFQNSYNSTREDNSPYLYMNSRGSFMEDYIGDTLSGTRERGSDSFINQDTTEGGFEDFRKPYQNLPAKQRNDSNKRIDDFQKYAQWSKSQGKRQPLKYKGHNFTPKASDDDYTDDYGTSYDE